MAIIKDKAAVAELAKVLGKRLRAARIGAEVSEQEAAKAIGHKGQTQICLAESGERVPPLPAIIILADLYGVSIDYLVGRFDDPLADPVETNQGAITRAVAKGVEGCFRQFAASVGAFTAASVIGRREDREDMAKIAQRAQEVKDSHERFVALNPSFEDARGGARLVAAIGNLNGSLIAAQKRIDAEQKAVKIRHVEACIEVEKFCLTSR